MSEINMIQYCRSTVLHKEKKPTNEKQKQHLKQEYVTWQSYSEFGER